MRRQPLMRAAVLVLVVASLGAATALHALPLRGAAVAPIASRHADTAAALCGSSRSPSRLPRRPQATVSVACARSGQGYPLSIGTEYIAVSPALAAPGTALQVWGSCGCGDSALPAPGVPVETVRLWLLSARKREITWQGRHVVVNDGRVLLAEARIDNHSNWSARVSVPRRIGAGFGLSRQVDTAAGPYAIMVTYPGEDAAARYYAVAPQEGYITAFVVTRHS